MNSIDIAKIAGVSRSTVSRVINNYPNVPDETRKKVLEVIKKYNYVPHASARLLAGVQNRIIGLFIIDMKTDTDGKQVTTSSYFTPFTGAIIDNANQLGYNVLVTIVSRLKDYKKAKEIFYNKTISGGVFIGQRSGEPEIKELIEAGYKVAVIDQSLKIEDDSFNKCIVVNADSFIGAYNATNYIINLGHTKIAHITGEVGQLSTTERVEGYKKALKDAGINIKNSYIVKGNFTEDGGYKATKKLLAKDRPTAIFVGNDSMALGAYRAIHEQGLSIPDDISVVGFDDIEVARYIKPSLTTIKMSLLEMASIATNSIIKSIEDNSTYYAKYTVPVGLIERESCAPLKK